MYTIVVIIRVPLIWISDMLNNGLSVDHNSSICDTSDGVRLQVICVALVWWLGVAIITLVSINEVNLRRARLVLGWVTTDH